MKKAFSILIISIFSLIASAQLPSNTKNTTDSQTHYLTDTLNINISDTMLMTFDFRDLYGYFSMSYGRKFILNYEISRHYVVKINDSIGLRKFSKISLPEVIDPTHHIHSTNVFRINDHYILKGDEHFSGPEISATIKENGVKREKQVLKQVKSKRHERLHYNTIDYADEYKYEIEGLQIGSELEISYSYNINLFDNLENFYSFNLFFDSEEPKDEFILNYKNISDIDIVISQFNGASKYFTSDSLNGSTWHLKNLTGGMNEEGARSYTELPYISFYNQPVYSLLASAKKHGAYKVDGCYYGLREVLDEIDTISRESMFSMTEYKNIITDCDYYKRKIAGDSANIKIITNLHNDIVDTYKYKSNDSYFTNYSLLKDNVNDNIHKKEMCEISKGKLYASYLKYLELPLKLAYINDNRSGIINRTYIRPLFEKNYYIVTRTDSNNLLYLKPKSNDFGYYMNEFPFYYENTVSRHFDPSKILIKDPDTELEVAFYNIPQIHMKHNERISNIKGNVNLVTGKIDYSTTISLKGQFSTLTRSVYIHNYLDPTINPLYKKTVFSDPNCKLESLTLVESQKSPPPFKTIFNLKYSQSNNIIKQNDSVFEFDFSNCINYIVNSVSLPRRTDYYADFKGKDIYSIVLNFNENIQLIDAPKMVYIENDFGTLNFSVNQITEKSITISSSFFTISSIIKKDAFQSVMSISDAINELKNSCKLIIKVIQ